MFSVLSDSLVPTPAIDEVRLPVAYANAQKALATCEKIDECKGWADKAAALASYARQSKDDSLRLMAIRIQARATRRYGTLLEAIQPQPGKRTDLEPNGGAPTRSQEATRAGISRDQMHTALRVASVPAAEFERQIESAKPPTVTKLAARGTQARTVVYREPISLAVAQLAKESLQTVYRFAAWCEQHDPAPITQAFSADEIAVISEYTAIIDGWLDRFVTDLRPMS